VHWSDVELDRLARARFRIDTPWGTAPVELAASGEHMVANAAAALAVAGVVEGRIDAAAEALATATVSGMRMEIVTTPAGVVVVNDAYNANPTRCGRLSGPSPGWMRLVGSRCSDRWASSKIRPPTIAA
jgi:UDP-N-acetylmuramoyl-tripeptide--D-alanyl-D-alanine ligase